MNRLTQALPTAQGHLFSVFSPRTALTSGCLPSVSSRESPSFLSGYSSRWLPGDRTCPQPSGQGTWGHTAHLSSDQQGLSSWAGHTHPPMHGQCASVTLSSHRPGILSHFCTTPSSFCTGSRNVHSGSAVLEVPPLPPLMLEDACPMLTFRGLHPPERCQL